MLASGFKGPWFKFWYLLLKKIEGQIWSVDLLNGLERAVVASQSECGVVSIHKWHK
jgi:hypothetical protein